MFNTAADARTYTQAGRATITLLSRKTGKHLTYKVSRAHNDDGSAKDLWFVGVLTGPENTSDYSYLGIISETGEFRTTGKSKFAPDSTVARAFNYFWKHAVADAIPADLEVRHSGHCGRCGRLLTVPESIEAGIGPECAGKMGL
jgi:hypothetical protein